MGANAGAAGEAAASNVDVNAGAEVDATGNENNADTKDAKATSANGDEPDGLKKALAAERKARVAAEKSLRDAELAKLPEMDRLKSENEELTTENEKLSKENEKMKIALDLELPWRIAKRITGDTPEEMREDAADLLKDYKARSDNKDNKRPTNDAKKSGGSSSTGLDMNRALRALAGKSGK